MQISWIVKKKRSPRATRGRGSSSSNNNNLMKMENMFNKLPMENNIEIINRLPMKEISMVMCVSKQWRNMVLHSCIPPPTPSLTIRNKNPLECMDEEEKENVTDAWLSRLVGTIAPRPFWNTKQLFKWCSNVMCCKIHKKKLIDSCNGLLLFFHKEGQAGNLTYGAYHYYVVNPITKQCLAVLKPEPCTAPYSYAALAYDPSESWFFKIVRFQGYRHMNVFSSESGCWTSLTFQLPEVVSKAKWEKKCVYSKGAIYRLSSSRHVIKFHVDPQGNVEKQAIAIEIPTYTFICNASHMDISMKGKTLCYVASTGKSLKVWELLEHFDGVDYSFTWMLTHGAKSENLMKLNRDGQFLAFHPYYGVTFYKLNNLIHYFFCCYDTMGSRQIDYDPGLYRYIKIVGFPFLECSTPFACCLDREHPRHFQRLPVP